MDYPPNGCECGFRNRFGEGRMRVHGLLHLLDGRFEVPPDNKLRNQLTRARPDDVRANDLAVLLVANDLDEAFGFAGGAGTSVRAPRERAYLDVEPLLARRRLGQPDRSNFG